MVLRNGTVWCSVRSECSERMMSVAHRWRKRGTPVLLEE